MTAVADSSAAAELRQYPFEPFTGEMPDEVLRMCVEDPITRVRLPDGRPAWLVLDYASCCTVLSDARFSRIPLGDMTVRNDEGVRDLNMDGAPHAAVRRVAGRPFTARRSDMFREKVQQFVDELVDDMVAAPQPVDVVSALIAPLPLLVICEVLGVPNTDRKMFYNWLAGLNSVLAYGSSDATDAQAEVRDYLTGQLAAKRADPGDDLLSAWLGEQGQTALTDPELVDLAMGVLIGALEINSTSAGLRALFLHPEQLRKLLDSPELIATATDEVLRYTAVSSLFRVQVVTEDLELGGVTMLAGDSVMAIPWVGNRDPRVFPDPNTFDVARVPAAPHLTFGFGPHFCLGAALGKMQVELALGTMLRRLPGLAPAIPVADIPWRHDRINCGIASLPVRWDA